jgi:glutaredoxin 2
MANDDVVTPTALVGKKVAPILEVPSTKLVMPESFDIVGKIDSDPMFGPTGMFKPMGGRKDIKDWQEKVTDISRTFQRPRYMMSVLPEFMQVDAKNYYVKNHIIPPYNDKDSWSKLTPAEQWKHYEEQYQKSLGMIDQLNAALVELDSMVYCSEHCSKEGLSLDDIDLWPRLRGVSNSNQPTVQYGS